MIAALSRAESWLLFCACIAVGVLVYVAIVGGWRYRQMEREAEDYADLERRASTSHLEYQRATMEEQRIRLARKRRPYDHELHGDFER